MATFFNQATLSYSGGTVNSNITTGEIIEVLSATKTAVVNEYSGSSDVTYVINIVNSGTTPFTGITVTDDLGAFVSDSLTLQPLDYVDGSINYFVNGVAQPSPVVTAGPPLVISGITIPANGVATLIYAAHTNEFAPPAEGGSITNTATINGGGITEIVVNETINAAEGPSLSITKSVTPTTVTENGQITYTFIIQNSGNTAAVATDNVVITDQFDPILSGITVTYNGTTWTEPANYTYNEATGLFSTVAGGITVPAATFTQDPVTGAFITEPGVATVTVTGTV